MKWLALIALFAQAFAGLPDGERGLPGPKVSNSSMSLQLRELQRPLGRCHTGDPPNTLATLHKAKHAASLLRKRDNIPPPELEKLTIKTWFWAVHGKGQKDQLPREDLEEQFKVLNDAYKPAQIEFHLEGLEWIENGEWAAGHDQAVMKAKYRRGHYADLNAWFITEEVYIGPGLGPMKAAGMASFPDYLYKNLAKYYNRTVDEVLDTANTMYANLTRDGVEVLALTLPGRTYKGKVYNGTTLVHEVGHWLGLLHPFQGKNCYGDGDFIHDTPPQIRPTKGCPTTDDGFQCPNAPGNLDFIHNYMDYSHCRTHFSEEQIRRMHEIYNELRKPFKDAPEREPGEKDNPDKSQ